MTGGTEVAMVQGPVRRGAANQTPAFTAYQDVGLTSMMGVGLLTTYCSGVPSIGRYCGAPSKLGVNLGPFFSGTVAVCGIEFSITASCACGVPGTDASTAPAGESGGMRLKSAGSALLAT